MKRIDWLRVAQALIRTPEGKVFFEVGQRVDPWGHPVPDEPQAGGGTCTITGIDRDSGAITLRKGAP